MTDPKLSQEEIDRCLAEAGPDRAYHAMDTGEVIECVEADVSRGLTKEEIEYRLDRDGLNQLVHKGRTSPIVLFFRQFLDTLILLLFIAAIVSIVINEKDWTDPTRYLASITCSSLSRKTRTSLLTIFLSSSRDFSAWYS
jgi:magnesium-transporting ATPase (P-type)